MPIFSLNRTFGRRFCHHFIAANAARGRFRRKTALEEVDGSFVLLLLLFVRVDGVLVNLSSIVF